MKIAFSVLLILVNCVVIAQDDPISYIRNIYQETENQIKDCNTSEYCSLVKNSLKVNDLGAQWRAVGNYSKVTSFWYTDDPSHCDDCGVEGKEVLRRVEIREFSGTMEYYYEYLFDKGKLIFHFRIAEDSEYRFYFDDGKLIRYMENKDITEDTTDMSAIVLSEAADLTEFFLKTF